MKQVIKNNEFASFYKNYINLAPNLEIVEALKNSKIEVLEVFKNLTEEKWIFRYAENKWTPKEMFLHIIDTERIMAYRALRIARNDLTPLPGFEENDYVPVSDANERSVESLIKEYKLQRKSTISLFKNLPQKSLENTGTASNNAISVRALAYIVAGHEKHHTNILKERYL